MTPPRLRSLLVSGFAMLLLPIASSAAPPPWIKAEADGVTVYSDASTKDATEFTASYLAYRDAVRRLLLPEGQVLKPAALMLFKTNKELTEIQYDESASTIVLAINVEIDGDAVVAVSVAGDRDGALATICEADTLRRLPQMGYALPLWAFRGVGSAISTLQIEKTGYTLGGNTKRLFDPIKYKRWLPWNEVSEMRPTSSTYSTADSFAVFAAQSWGLIQLVMFSEPAKARERFQALVMELQVNPSADSAVANVLGIPVNSVSERVKQSVWAKNKFAVPFDVAAARARVSVSPAKEWEVALYRAKLFQGFARREQADRELQKAVTLAPHEPDVLAALGFAHLQRADRRLAVDYYREAIAAGATNPKYYLTSARMRLDDLRGASGDEPGRGGKAAAEAVAEIRHAITLAPDDGQAFEMLGRAFFVSEHVSQANIDELNPGFSSVQYGARIRFLRALLEERLEQHANSLIDLKRVLANPLLPVQDRKAMLTDVANIRSAILGQQVNRLVRAEKFAEAYALVDEVLEMPTWEIVVKDRDNLRAFISAREAQSKQ